MKFNPIALFTTLTVAAAGAAGYVALNPTLISPVQPVAVVSAPAPVAEVPVVKPVEVKPVEVKPAEVKPAEVKPAEVKPAEVKPAEIKPAEVKPVEVKPVEQVAVATQPVTQPEPKPTIAPSFDTVRVETGGETVIAGRAEPDTEVLAKLNGVVIATAKTSSDGSFVMIPDNPLPAGAGTLSLETQIDGVVVASAETVAVAVKPKGEGEATIAVLTPDQPTKIVQAPASPSNSVVLDTVDYNAAGDIVFSGRAQPGAVVRLYVDNAIAGEAKADDGGKWIYAGQSEVPAGTHTLRADAIAADGSVSSRVELPFMREAPAKVAESAPAPVVAPAAAPVTAPAAPAVVVEVPAVAVEVPAVAAPVAAAPAQVAAVPAPEAAAPAAAPVAAAPAPAVAVAAPPAAPQPTRIVIQPGNNLWTLSRELYGFGRKYTVIYEANKSQIRNPHLIFPGQILTAPVAAN